MGEQTLKKAPVSAKTLRNSRSVPALPHQLKHKPSAISRLSTTAQTSTSSLNPPKKLGFFRRVTSEWNLLVFRIKSISKELSTDEQVEELFVEQDSDELSMDRLLKVNRAYNSAEEAFLQEYKKFKNLDKMVQYHQQHPPQSEEVKSSTTAVSDSHNKISCTLQDIIRQSTANNSEDTRHEDDENLELENEISFHDLDLCKLRQEFELHQGSDSSEPDTLRSTTSNNIGTTLWEYRRKKWLQNANPQKVAASLENSSIAHIPKESYYKIYNILVEKGRTLKDDKKLNLLDLIHIINAGWIAEEKWERAAKGLA